MQYRITAPQMVRDAVNLPASKSISNRILIINSLTEGGQDVKNISNCDDTNILKGILTTLPNKINIGPAGTAMRFLTAFLAQQEGEFVITGSTRMLERPLKLLVNALKEIGADIEYIEKEGYPPLKIKGKKLLSKRIEMPGNVSSQYITALLLIAPNLDKGLEIEITGNIVSRPYIDLTLCIMRYFGAKVDWTSSNTIKVENKPYEKKEYIVESDWSAAACWYETMAILQNENSEIILPKLFNGSRQGDSSMRFLFSMFGIKTEFEKQEQYDTSRVVLKCNNKKLTRLDYDFSNQPDLAQYVAVTCCLLNTNFHFTGLETLKIKETDRLNALQQELRKLGYVIEIKNEAELIWNGETTQPEEDIVINTYEDHRMAMAFAPACIKYDNIKIDNPQVVSKSYPLFWEDMKTLGFNITME